MFRQLFACASVAMGVILLVVSVLISAAIWLEAKDQGWLVLGAAPINWSSLSDLIMYGSVLGCLGALLLFDGLRELQCRSNRGA